MKIYTKTGDDGTTGLYGGARRSKASVRVDSYGTVDELNCLLGTIRAFNRERVIDSVLIQVQNDLFTIGTDLATLFENEPSTVLRTDSSMTTELERWIDEIENQLPPLRNFILPAGSSASALLHLARSVCRRAERQVVRLSHDETVNPEVIRYLNRLADLLFVLARYANQKAGCDDVIWNSKP